MLKKLLGKLFGTINERHLKEFQKIVVQINDLEGDFINMSDDELKGVTQQLKQEHQAGKTLDELLPRAFAVVREAAKRTLGQRHYDVQLMGGIALHKGMIPEMRTGEGKTLVSTLPAYLNALTGKGVHIVTVNDYLAQRDSSWMGQIHHFLGLKVGCITGGMDDNARKLAYQCDITYCTNNELGFDYLRNNMKYSIEHLTNHGYYYAIIDEVDSILIDEARTPLIISGPAEDSSELYFKINQLIPKLLPTDYDIDEKSRAITLNEVGINHVEELLLSAKLIEENTGLYDVDNINILHHVNQALKAHKLFKRDTDYMVKDGKVLIVDEFTGRILDGRRFSEGLHQALEAKEMVAIQNENQTLASITFQNYFRLYQKLAGMTGTAMTEANELREIYNLEVVAIPTHNPVIRKDEDDIIYRTAAEKYEAIINEIELCHKKKQPILVGTISIEKSEYLSQLLNKRKIPHQVLNAKYHEQEAYIIAQAGRAGAVTIATNMAGRGTDIMLGGNPDMLIRELNIEDDKKLALEIAKIKKEVAENKQLATEAGGLLVIGTERHESRRIDNQLRGRSGRMGDPGRTLFYLSLEDDLMRIFASPRISAMLKTLGLKDGEAIFHPMITRAIEKAQQKVEARNYDTRKSLLRFDDVMNEQRKVIYEQRNEIMSSDEVNDIVLDMYHTVNEEIVHQYLPEKSYKEDWDVEGLQKKLHHVYGQDFDVVNKINSSNFEQKSMITELNEQVAKILQDKEKSFGEKLYQVALQRILLISLDQLWKDHLLSLDHLRQGIYLRAYGQRDPLSEYKKEAFNLFSSLLDHLRELYITRICRMEVEQNATEANHLLDSNFEPHQTMNAGHNDPAKANLTENIGRNDPCYCGSGKKYKHCHGKIN